MSKQDRQAVRNVTGLEYKYNFGKTFAELLGLQEQTRKDLEEQEAIMEAELSLRIMYDDNDQIVSMLNASADIVKLTSNRLEIESDHFSLSADGTIKATAGIIGGCRIVDGLLVVPTARIDGTIMADQIDAEGLEVTDGVFDNCVIKDTCEIQGVLTGNRISSNYDAVHYCSGTIEFSSSNEGSYYKFEMTRAASSAGMRIGTYESWSSVRLYSDNGIVQVGGDHGFYVNSIGGDIEMNAPHGGYLTGTWYLNGVDISTFDERLKKLEGTA